MTEKNPETFGAIISTYVNEQVPEFVRQNHPYFVEYLKTYYQFLEQPMQATGRIAAFRDSIDIDFSTDEFFTLFKSTFLSPFPEEFVADKAIVVKRVKDLYASKGSIPSIKLLFRILYGEEISVFLPKTKLLRASDGKWTKNIHLYVEALEGNPITFGRHSFIGETSGAIADVDFVSKSQEGPYTVWTLHILTYEGEFIPGETIRERTTGELAAIVFGFVSGIEIVDGGDDYTVDDFIPIVDTNGVNALAYVDKVDATYPVNGFIIDDGGDGYRVGDPIDFTPNAVNGFGAIAKVSTITPTASTLVFTSIIGDFQNTVLFDVSTIAIEDFGDSEIIDTGEITGINIEDPGKFYPSAPFEVIVNQKTPTLGFPAGTGAEVYATTINTGKILEARIDNGGVGYTNLTTADFTGIGNGNAIGNVIISGGPQVSGGYYRNTDGQLSSDMVLEDNVYWQNYSYEITSSRSINEWRSVVKAITHPAGYALWGNLEILNKITNPFYINLEPVDKCIQVLTGMPVTVSKYVDIDYFALAACHNYLIYIPLVGDYYDHQILIYAGITLEDFFYCLVEEAPLIDDYDEEFILDWANTTLLDFFDICGDPCLRQRRAIIHFFHQPLFEGLALGFRWNHPEPIIEDFWQIPISRFADTQLFDFMEFSSPFIDQFEHKTVNHYKNMTLQAFYDQYDFTDQYKQYRSIIKGPFDPNLISFVEHLGVTLEATTIAEFATTPIESEAPTTLEDFLSLGIDPKYLQRKAVIPFFPKIISFVPFIGTVFDIPIIRDFANIPLGYFQHVPLEEFFGLTLDPDYFARSALVPFFAVIESFVEGHNVVLGQIVIGDYETAQIVEFQNTSIEDFDTLDVAPKYTQRITRIEIETA